MNFYVSLWDDYGVEANFPGYSRMPVQMGPSTTGTFSNLTSVQWPVMGVSGQTLTKIRLHEQQYGHDLFEVRLTHPVPRLCTGDTINFGPNGVSVTLSDTMTTGFGRKATISADTYEEFTKEHPNATAQEIWEAAFVAGHQTAHTLLTGEAQ